MPCLAVQPTQQNRPLVAFRFISTSSSASSLSSSPLFFLTYPNQLLGLPHGHYAGMSSLPHLLSLEDHVYSSDAPTALRLGWGTLRPLDFRPEVHIGMGRFENTLALVV